MRSTHLALALVLVAGVGGCGSDDEGSSESSKSSDQPARTTSAPAPKFAVQGDRATAPAKSEAAAKKACEAAQAGDYADQLKGVTQVQFKLPQSGGADYTCVLPG